MASNPPSTELTPLSDEERRRLEQSLTRLDRLARLMDEQFKLPVVNYRIGLDPIIGVIPGAGDWATWIVGVYIFWRSLRLEAPRPVLGRMVVNLLIDLVVGYVPALGDAFDAAFKANRKNVDMLLDYYGARRKRGAIELPGDVSDHLETRRTQSRLKRYAAGAAVVLVLLAVTALPFVVLWWLLTGG